MGQMYNKWSKCTRKQGYNKADGGGVDGVARERWRRRGGGGAGLLAALVRGFWLPLTSSPVAQMSNGGGARPLPPVPLMAAMAASRRRLFDRCKIPI